MQFKRENGRCPSGDDHFENDLPQPDNEGLGSLWDECNAQLGLASD